MLFRMFLATPPIAFVTTHTHTATWKKGVATLAVSDNNITPLGAYNKTLSALSRPPPSNSDHFQTYSEKGPKDSQTVCTFGGALTPASWQGFLPPLSKCGLLALPSAVLNVFLHLRVLGAVPEPLNNLACPSIRTRRLDDVVRQPV